MRSHSAVLQGVCTAVPRSALTAPYHTGVGAGSSADGYLSAYLQHRPRVLCIGSRMPHVAGGQSFGDGLPRVCQQAFPLNIYAMLLVPLHARPTAVETALRNAV